MVEPEAGKASWMFYPLHRVEHSPGRRGRPFGKVATVKCVIFVAQLLTLISDPADDVHAGAHPLKVDPVTRSGENKTSRHDPQVVASPSDDATNPSSSLAGTDKSGPTPGGMYQVGDVKSPSGVEAEPWPIFSARSRR